VGEQLDCLEGLGGGFGSLCCFQDLDLLVKMVLFFCEVDDLGIEGGDALLQLVVILYMKQFGILIQIDGVGNS